MVQHLKIGDLTKFPSRLPFPDDDESTEMAYDNMDQFDTPRLGKAEERSLMRDSTAGFAGMKVSFCVHLA